MHNFKSGKVHFKLLTNDIKFCAMNDFNNTRKPILTS